MAGTLVNEFLDTKLETAYSVETLEKDKYIPVLK
jgi:hypothetical protein